VVCLTLFVVKDIFFGIHIAIDYVLKIFPLLMVNSKTYCFVEILFFLVQIII